MTLRPLGAVALVAGMALTVPGPFIDGGHAAVRVARGVQVVDPPVNPPVAPSSSRCPNAYLPAMFAGWPDADWPTLDAIIWRESRCTPGAWHVNRNGTVDSGLMQINSVHWGWLEAEGITPAMLLDGYWNMRAARLLWLRAGWAPWAL